MSSLFAWRGIDDPQRFDVASLSLEADSMRAHGTSITRSYASSWSLEVGRGWVTRSLAVQVHGGDWRRSLLLERDEHGRWHAAATTSGDADYPAPGLVNPSDVEDALDCDLALCPVTNTMPIRRLSLRDRAVPATALVMAWVDVPTLQVVRSDQTYAADPAASPGRVQFASDGGDFRSELTIDDDGIVIDYPQLARRARLPR